MASNFDKGWRGDHKHRIMDRPFMPKNGTVSQVLLQLVVACTSPKFILSNPPPPQKKKKKLMSRIDNTSFVIWILPKNHLPIVKLSLIAKSTSSTTFFAHWFPPYCLFTYNSSMHKPTNTDKQWVFWKSNHVLGSEDQFKPCRCILQWRASGNHEGGGSEFTFMHQSIPPTPKCPTPRTDKVGKCPVVAQGGAGCRGNWLMH